MDQRTYAVVALVCERLTDIELAAINNVAQVDWNPRMAVAYEKIKHLFTEGGGMRMHTDVKEALARVVLERLT